VDPLTRLWNRGAILEVLELELGRAVRSGASVGVIAADLDHFKRVNDTYGHPIGDAVLQEAARRFRSCLRPTDTAGRVGGEEFLILLPDVDMPLAQDITERIRTAIEKDAFVTATGNVRVTCSFGLGVTPNNPSLSTESILAQVDKALYAAKNDGRNCVRHCVFE
jgi:two-component system, cell cycle response regulator